MRRLSRTIRRSVYARGGLDLGTWLTTNTFNILVQAHHSSHSSPGHSTSSTSTLASSVRSACPILLRSLLTGLLSSFVVPTCLRLRRPVGRDRIMLAAFLLVLISPLVLAACTLDFGSYDLDGTSTASGACRYTFQYGIVTERWAWSYI